MGNTAQALEWLSIMISLVPTDPGVLKKLGQLYLPTDQSQAFHYYSESYRFYPSDLEVASYLGAYYAGSHMYEQALPYFQRCYLVSPTPEYLLLISSCLKKSGNLQAAFDVLKVGAKKFDVIEVLKALGTIGGELGVDVSEVRQRIVKLEKKEREKGERAGSAKTSSFAPIPEEKPVRPTTAARRKEEIDWNDDVNALLPD